MPFTCAVCGLDIQIGEPMLSDEKMNLAHELCVRSKKEVDPPTTIYIPPTAVHLPTVTAPSPPPAPPSLPLPAYVAPTFSPPLHQVPPPIPSVCIECQKPAISMCPICLRRVHQDYGYCGDNCSGRHESRCPAASELRAPKYTASMKLKHPIVIGEPIIVFDPSVKIVNGKIKVHKKNGKKERR